MKCVPFVYIKIWIDPVECSHLIIIPVVLIPDIPKLHVAFVTNYRPNQSLRDQLTNYHEYM